MIARGYPRYKGYEKVYDQNLYTNKNSDESKCRKD